MSETKPSDAWVDVDNLPLLEVGHIVGAFSYLTRTADGFGLVRDPATQLASETAAPLRRSRS